MQVQRLKIIEHNVIKWTFSRRNELYNYYKTEDPDVVLLNSTGILDTEKIKIYQYNVHQRNLYAEHL